MFPKGRSDETKSKAHYKLSNQGIPTRIRVIDIVIIVVAPGIALLIVESRSVSVDEVDWILSSVERHGSRSSP